MSISPLINIKHLQGILFFICLFSITRQFPFTGISNLIVPSLLALFLVSFKEVFQRITMRQHFQMTVVFAGNIISLLIILGYSTVICQNDIFLVARFFLIIVLILTAHFFHPNPTFNKIFFTLAIVHAIVLIGIELFVLCNKELYQTGIIREYFRNSDLGDVYTHNGWIYRVALNGSSIIPVALYLSIIYFQSSKIKYFIVILLAIATIISGNFAFLFSSLFFIFLHVLLLSKWSLGKIVTCIILIAGCSLIYSITLHEQIASTYEMKSYSSLPVRHEQLLLLIDDVFETPSSLLFGKGLGHLMAKQGLLRDYTKAFSYEFQAAYLFNQVGLLFGILFFSTLVVFALYFICNSALLLAYVSYIVYAMTNPYIFDSFHILLILVLISIHKEVSCMSFQCPSSRFNNISA